jgi:hypothetical protein
MGPRAGLDALEKRKFLLLLAIKPRSSTSYPVAIPTEISGLFFRKVSYSKYNIPSRRFTRETNDNSSLNNR